MNWFNSIIHKQESNVTTDTSLTTTSTPALTSDQVLSLIHISEPTRPY